MPTSVPIGIQSIKSGNTLFVDGVNGVNATAQRGRQDKPYLTIASAQSAVTSGDVLRIGPAAYNESDLVDGNRKSVTSLVRAVTNTNVGTVTATCTAHGLAVGDEVRIQGATGTVSFNGPWIVTAVPTANTFQYRQFTTTAETAGGTIYVYPLVRMRLEPGAAVYKISSSELGIFDDSSRGSNAPTFMSVTGSGTFFCDAAGATNGTGNTYAPIIMTQAQSAWSITGDKLIVNSGGSVASVPAVYTSAGDIDIAFAEIRSDSYDCLWIDGSTLFTSFSRRLIAADSPIEFSGLANGGAAAIYFVYAESTATASSGRITYGGTDTGIRAVQGAYYKGGIYVNGSAFFKMTGAVIDDAQSTLDDCNSVIFNEGGIGAGVFDGCEIIARKSSRRIVAHNALVSSNNLIFRNCKFRILGTGTYWNESVDGDAITYRLEGVNHSNVHPDMTYCSFVGGGSLVVDVTGGFVEYRNNTISGTIKKTTTNATPATTVTIPLAANMAYYAELRTVVRRTDSGTENAIHTSKYRVQVASGTVTVESVGVSTLSQVGLVTETPTFAASGQGVAIGFTGESAKTLKITQDFRFVAND